MYKIAALVRPAQLFLTLTTLVLSTLGQAGPISGRVEALGTRKDLTVHAGVPSVDRTVNTIADTFDGVCDADCSFRDAVAAASNGDRVVFASPLFDTPQTISFTFETLVESRNISIVGPGAKLLTLVADPSGNHRVLTFVDSNSSVSDLTVTGAHALASVGGGIGIFGGSLTLTRVNVSGNIASVGGGIFIYQASANIIDSSVIGNTANQCGGILAESFSSLSLFNTTVSGNTASGDYGGGVCVNEFSQVLAANSTVVNNTAATTGGGAYVSSDSTLTFSSSIFARNEQSFGNGDLRIDGGSTSLGYNLIGDSAGDAANTGNTVTYQINDVTDTDPLLGGLSDAFSPTPVHLPLPGSPVIDKGNNSSGLSNDQAQNVRTFDNLSVPNASGGDGTDIGSVERQAPTAGEVSVGGRVMDSNGRAIKGAVITLQRMNNGQTIIAITGAFGYYSFDELAAGEAYIVSVVAKRKSFVPASHFFSAGASAFDVDFVAAPAGNALTR